MDSTLQTAWNLYNNAKKEIFDDQFPDPVVWFYNKEKYIGKANSCDNVVKQAMLDNSLPIVCSTCVIIFKSLI